MTAADVALGAPESKPRSPDPWVTGLGILLLLGGALALDLSFEGRQAWLYLLGGAFGLVLYHASFGFTGAWRVFIADGRGAGLRAQMIMLALTTACFLPIIAAGSLFGRPAGGFIAPVGVSVTVGAFLFGLGMQLGGGCASGTLFTVGGGRSRMLVTLVFFCVGSVIGTAHLPWWLQQYSLGSISLSRELGALGAIGLQWSVFGAIVLATVVVERRRHGRLEPIMRSDKGRSRLLRGPWPLLAGAVLLAGLNVATLALAGHPWGVSSGYTLWGAKAASALGVDLGSWSYWATPGRQRQLEASVFANTISVMNFGIIVGAFLAAGLAGRFAPERRIPWRSLLAAAFGGLLMGYGARLAFGCNVGAYFSGIASGSLHGWLWFLAALVGSYLGTRLRPAFGLLVERSAPCRT